MLLVGDIGGTKTDVAILPITHDLSHTPKPEFQATFKSADYQSLEAVIEKFLENKKITVTRAIFGVAGPVVHGESKITNLSWRISEKSLQERLKIPFVKLLNDLEAIGHAIPYLPEGELETLNP